MNCTMNREETYKLATSQNQTPANFGLPFHQPDPVCRQSQETDRRHDGENNLFEQQCEVELSPAS